MYDYAEVVVNQRIIRYREITQDDISRVEVREQAETRLKTFHYHIPSPLKDQLKPGHLVAVPFRHQVLQGVVVALDNESPVEKTRPIQSLLDPQPIFTPAQLALARWLAEEYLAPLPTCINLFLPPGADRQPVTVVEAVPDVPLPSDLTPLERALYLHLQQKKAMPLENLEAKVVDGLLKQGLVRKRATLSPPKVGPRIERTVELLIPPDEIDDALLGLGRASKQADILLYLAEIDDPLPTVESVLQSVGCTMGPLKALEKKGWLQVHPKQTLVAIPPQAASEPDTLNPAQKKILLKLKETNTPMPRADLDLAVSSLREMMEAGLIISIEEPARVALNLPHDRISTAVVELRRATRHAAVLSLLAAEEGPVWVGWIYAQTEATTKTLQDLAEAGLIAIDEARRWRDPLAERTFTTSTPPPLTDEQAAIFEVIRTTLARHYKPYLIHGVTGSGKTEIYLRAMDLVLKEGKGVIFLVPEVMLATQIVERVQARFPKQVALWHSSLSPGERFDTWERVRSGELSIVVGPRSALFAPLQKPGLIIIDEEHEPAYKQERTPTFHAREVAIEYARLNDTPVIMGSATPDVISYRKAQRGEYHLLSLPNRILAHKKHLAVQASLMKQRTKVPAAVTNYSADFITLPLPPVEVVDLREELQAGNRSIFSRALTRAIHETLEAGEQVILFLNRRGTATFVNCRDCGHVMACPRCDTTLTYHAPTELLACHYCGYREPIPEACPICNRSRIRYFGLGTERVEDTLRRMFPEARPIRFDQDTTRRTGSHYTFLQQFIEGRSNVMVGTQMVAKGLDLPLVTLVGVISADTALYLPDFRSAERTFQVLMQVAGRAGRSPLGGRVIIQTYTPDQPAIVAASGHDYLGFYNEELRFRYEQGYPPFKRLARLRYSGSGYEKSRRIAEDMANRLRLWVEQQGFPSVEIIGPAPAYVQRLRTKYRWQIIVHAPDPAKVLGPIPLPLGWQVDIDPVSLL
jgi:primosomal protein N' (replication factor Y)